MVQTTLGKETETVQMGGSDAPPAVGGARNHDSSHSEALRATAGRGTRQSPEPNSSARVFPDSKSQVAQSWKGGAPKKNRATSRPLISCPRSVRRTSCRSSRRRRPIPAGSVCGTAPSSQCPRSAIRPGHGTCTRSLPPRRLVDDQLADHRIVVRRHGVAGVGVRIEPHAEPTGHDHPLDRSGAGLEVLPDVLGVDAALHGHAARTGSPLATSATARRPRSQSAP